MGEESLEQRTISQLNEEALTLHKLIDFLNKRIEELEAQLDKCREMKDVEEDRGLLLVDNLTDWEADEESLSRWVEARRIAPKKKHLDLETWL